MVLNFKTELMGRKQQFTLEKLKLIFLWLINIFRLVLPIWIKKNGNSDNYSADLCT